jgi:parallel beta-helix repeat protein
MENNCFMNGDHGINLQNSENNTISNNYCNKNSLSGVYLDTSSTNNTISDNVCSSNQRNGIEMKNSNNNTFSDNDLISNENDGFQLDSSHNNTITRNFFSMNNNSGIRLGSSYNNTMLYNIFVSNNESHVWASNSDWNEWDDNGRGNYWDDYKTSYPSATNDGYVWSIPYKIDGSTNTHDNYPLVTQDGSFLDEILPAWVQTPSNQTMYNNQSFKYDINASDNVEIDTYWLNASSALQIAENGTITNTSILSVGNYEIKVFVNDTSDNTISKTFNLQVQEATTSDGDVGDDDGDQDDGDDDTGDGGQDGLSIRGSNLGIIIGIVSIAIIGIAKSSKLKKFYSE